MIPDEVLYTRYTKNITEPDHGISKLEKPDAIVRQYYQSHFGRSAPVIGERCIMHQTSDHFDSSGDVFLTYILYSDDFDFRDLGVPRISWRDAFALAYRLSEPDVSSSETGILAHGLRHIAWLVKNDSIGPDGLYQKCCNPMTVLRFQKFPVGLAGEVR